MEIYVEQLKTFTLEDISVINKLLKQLNATTAAFVTKTDMEDMITSPVNILFVARRSDTKEIVGMLTLVVFRIPFAKKGLLEDFIVDKKYRGKGIGSKLIEAAINKARTDEVSYLDFTSRPARLAANNLYKSLGFKKRDTNVYRIIL